jgi:hypothetical protein
MIQGTILKNGVLRLLLTGSDSMDEDCLKQLDGATVKFVSENLKLFDKNLTGALVLEVTHKPKSDDREPTRGVETYSERGVQ